MKEEPQGTEIDSDCPSDLPENSVHSYDPSKTSFRGSTEATIRESRDQGEFGCDEEGKDPEARRFHLLNLIGKGGFGEVWEAIQISLGRVVAVKKLRTDVVKSQVESRGNADELQTSFHQEAVTTAHLDHPNIIPVYEEGKDSSGLPILAMKRVHGTPWNELILKDFAQKIAAEFLSVHIPILIDVCQAVAFAHSRGVVHRDIKPSQVMIGEFGEVVLMDWGLAVVYSHEKLNLSGECERNRHLPSPGEASNPAGTVAFMAPEQTEKDSSKIGPWTDVYLLGGTLYYLLTGKLPHRGDNPKEVFMKARLGMIVPPSTITPNRDIPADLEDLVMRAMEPEIDKRIQNVGAFLEDLKNFFTGATRRKQSRELCGEVERTLGGIVDYRALAECHSKLARAQTLWPENEDVVILRDRVSSRFASLAMEEGDLRLARLQGESISSEIDRQSIIHDLESRELRQKRRELQRRTATVSTIVLVFVIIAAVGVFANYLSIQRDIAFQERDQREIAFVKANNLVNFILDDLVDALSPSGQLQPMRDIGEEVVRYFESLSPEERNSLTDAQYATANEILAEVHVAMGNTDTALSYLRTSERVWKSLPQEDIGDFNPPLRLGRNYLIQSYIMSENGEDLKSEQLLFKGVLTSFKEILLQEERQGPSIGTEMTLERVDMYIQDTEAIIEREDRYELILDMLESAADHSRESMDWELRFARSFRLVGIFLQDKRDPELAREAYERATLLSAEGLKTMEGLDHSERQNAEFINLLSLHIDSLYRSGEVQWTEGNQTEAISYFAQALEKVEELSSYPSQRIASLKSMSAIYAKLGEYALLTGNYPDANTTLTEAVRLSEQLVDHDSQNVLWKADLAERYILLGDYYAEQGDVEEANDQDRKARKLLHSLKEKNPSNERYEELLKRVGDP